MKVQHPNGSRPAGTAGRHHSWQLRALLAVGGWLVVSPLVLSTTRVTAGVVSAVAGGLGVAVLAGWALAARNQIPPWPSPASSVCGWCWSPRCGSSATGWTAARGWSRSPRRP
jgi:DNA-binding transcriptional LysR family regulator